MPKSPGVSVQLSYPVLLAGQRTLAVKDDEQNLTTTTVASGLNFPEFALIDSEGAKYSVRKVTDFGRGSVFSDMGTRPFRVFLDLKQDARLKLKEAKQLVIDVALAPGSIAGSTPHGADVAKQAIQGAETVGELIEVCRTSWQWR